MPSVCGVSGATQTIASHCDITLFSDVSKKPNASAISCGKYGSWTHRSTSKGRNSFISRRPMWPPPINPTRLPVSIPAIGCMVERS